MRGGVTPLGIKKVARREGVQGDYSGREILAEETGWHRFMQAFRMPTKTKSGVFCILKFKRMPDVTDQYLLRARQVAEDQYDSIRIALRNTLQRQGWMVKQISVIGGTLAK
jgi:hypothetical protein